VRIFSKAGSLSLIATFVAITAGSSASANPAVLQRDNLVHVAFLIPGDPSAAAATSPGIIALANNINTAGQQPGYLHAFVACVIGAPSAGQAGTPSATPCANLSDEDVLVTTSLGLQDSSTKLFPVTLLAASLRTQQRSGSLIVYVKAASGATAPDPSDFSTVVLALTTGQEQSLLGTPVLSNGIVTLSAFDPFLQLVPESATDRKYVDLLGHYLAKRRIQFEVSPFTGVSSSTPVVGADPCANSPRYLHYQVTLREQPEPLLFKTEVYASATGQIIDCANPAVPLTFSSAAKKSVVTSKGSLASIVGILTLALVSKSNSWGNVAAVANGVGGFVDTDPTAVTVEQQLYNETLRGLVADLCVAISENKASEQRRPGGVQSRERGQSPATAGPRDTGPGGPGGAAAPGGASSSVGNSLATGAILVPEQPPLVCANS